MDIGPEPARESKRHYRVASATASFFPSKVFAGTELDEALRYGREATRAFRTRFAVWEVDGGRLRHVRTFQLEPAPA